MYEYKVIDGEVITSKKRKFADVLQDFLNNMAKDGWEFYCQTTTKELVPQGCLFFTSEPKIYYNQTFIFRRPKDYKNENN